MWSGNFGRGWVVMAVMAGVACGGQSAWAKMHHTAHHTTANAASSGASQFSSVPPGGAQFGPGQKKSGQMSDAEKLRRLDIMLLVTGLRCRATADDFQPDFQTFEAKHRSDLNAADRQLRVQFGGRHGSVSNKAMDHINVEMANVYGNGHPWMGCHDLKGVVQDLAQVAGARPLLVVADQLLAPPTIMAQP